MVASIVAVGYGRLRGRSGRELGDVTKAGFAETGRWFRNVSRYADSMPNLALNLVRRVARDMPMPVPSSGAFLLLSEYEMALQGGLLLM
jgi:hypothetical protein